MRGVFFFIVFIIFARSACAITYQVDGDVVGEITHYTVEEGDTLYSIARDYDVGIVEVIAANPGVDVWLPKEGTELILPTMYVLPVVPRKGIIINLSELRLFYFPDEHTVMTFPIGIGMEGWQTPLGDTTIVLKREDPEWIPPESMRKENPDLPDIVPPGPDNPLGEYALNMGWINYRIHGTNRPQGVGRRSSHGCIRLYPEDIEQLFDIVKVGTSVTAIDEPVKLGWKNNMLYLQVTPAQEQLDDIAARRTPIPVSLHGVHKAVREAVGNKVMDIDWYGVDDALLEHNGVAQIIAVPHP